MENVGKWLGKGIKGHFVKDPASYVLFCKGVWQHCSPSQELKATSIQFDVQRDLGQGSKLEVSILCNAAAATKGLLYAICTQDPEANAMRPVIFNLTVENLQSGGGIKEICRTWLRLLGRSQDSVVFPPIMDASCPGDRLSRSCHRVT
jgi:hypothetical protein